MSTRAPFEALRGERSQALEAKNAVALAQMADQLTEKDQELQDVTDQVGAVSPQRPRVSRWWRVAWRGSSRVARVCSCPPRARLRVPVAGGGVSRV
jgi:hypothetical protein